MKCIRTMIAAAAASFAMFLMAAPAYASVSRIAIQVEDVVNEGEELREPEITVSESSDCEIADISWSKDVSKWKPASRVAATLTLVSDDTFSGKYNADTCRVTGGNFSTATKVDDNTLKVRITYIPRAQLGETEKAGWGKTKNLAVWKKVPYATAYQLRLFRDGSLIKTMTVTGTSVDLSEYMDQEADYYYQVRAMGESSGERYYLLSGEYVESEDIVLEDLGETEGAWRTYQEGTKYVRPDGSSPVSAWEKIVGEWYYFDANGYMATGWQNVNGDWYYLDTDGKMAAGWKEIDGLWYYLDETGRMKTGWLQTTPGTWYYLNPDGSMAVDTVVDGQYYVDAAGQWKG